MKRYIILLILFGGLALDGLKAQAFSTYPDDENASYRLPVENRLIESDDIDRLSEAINFNESAGLNENASLRGATDPGGNPTRNAIPVSDSYAVILLACLMYGIRLKKKKIP